MGNTREAFVETSEPGMFIGSVSREGERERILAEPKNSNLQERKEKASNGNRNFLQMWSLKESRESKAIFSKSKSANHDRRHRLLSLTFGYKQHFHI